MPCGCAKSWPRVRLRSGEVLRSIDRSGSGGQHGRAFVRGGDLRDGVPRQRSISSRPERTTALSSAGTRAGGQTIGADQAACTHQPASIGSGVLSFDTRLSPGHSSHRSEPVADAARGLARYEHPAQSFGAVRPTTPDCTSDLTRSCALSRRASARLSVVQEPQEFSCRTLSIGSCSRVRSWRTRPCHWLSTSILLPIRKHPRPINTSIPARPTSRHQCRSAVRVQGRHGCRMRRRCSPSTEHSASGRPWCTALVFFNTFAMRGLAGNGNLAASTG